MQKLKVKTKSLEFCIVILLFASCILNFTGCAPTPYVKPTPPPGIPGNYHRVEKGETLWRISKMYNVELEDLVRANHIQDATLIEAGQLILIPNRKIQLSSSVKYTCDDFIWPIKGKVIASFGQTFNNTINKGINIRPYSNLDVVASEGGKVVFYSDNFGSFGKTIIIDHGNGISTVYARNREVYIKAGDNIRKGTVISKAGSAGRDGSIYLHFEVRKGHISQNPYYYLP